MAADDIVFIWGGDVAYSEWDASNDLLRRTFVDLQYKKTATVTLSVAARQYVPFRVMFGQAGGPYSFDIRIDAPDGTSVFGANSDANPYTVQYSCDGISAPQYPSWLKET